MIYQGKFASAGQHTGPVRVLRSPGDITKLVAGDIMAVKLTTPDWIAAFAQIKANGGGIITMVGGLTSHAAVVCREYGIPCVVGLKEALELDGKHVTMDGATGKVEVHA